MRTPEEIVARIKERENIDFFGFERVDYIERLDFQHAKEFLVEAATEEQWEPAPYTREAILQRMKEYMPFAWEKANNFRGLSAMRSMHHYTAWIWLLGDDLGDLLAYENYGKDNLVKICEKYGWDHTQWDDGVRKNHED